MKNIDCWLLWSLLWLETLTVTLVPPFSNMSKVWGCPTSCNSWAISPANEQRPDRSPVFDGPPSQNRKPESKGQISHTRFPTPRFPHTSTEFLRSRVRLFQLLECDPSGHCFLSIQLFPPDWAARYAVLCCREESWESFSEPLQSFAAPRTKFHWCRNSGTNHTKGFRLQTYGIQSACPARAGPPL